MRNNLVERATSFAAHKHKDQYRKEGKILYISHLVSVALILKKYDFEDTVIAAGLLHDTLEDTETSEEEILENFGQEILSIILLLTYDKNLSWKDQKMKYIEDVRNANEFVKAISLADKIHNIQSLLFNLEVKGDLAWSSFKQNKDTKIWFEKECLKMFQETFSHPMVAEYEKLIIELLII